MNLCFIVEERYRHELMPMSVVQQLRDWGHRVDVLEPHRTVTCLTALNAARAYDAVVLKTVTDGPGLTLLEAAAATGIPTINSVNSIRLVRNKAVAAAVAAANGIPTPPTYFAARTEQLANVGFDEYPIVVKPCNGSSGRSVHLVRSPRQLEAVRVDESQDRFLLAQGYAVNPGYDVKLYALDGELFATSRPSPLHPEVVFEQHATPVTPELRGIAMRVATVFGLDIFGVDVVRTVSGWVVVDVNDFPSFGVVPDAVPRVAATVLRLAARAARSKHGTAGSPPLGAAVDVVVARSES